MKGHSRIMALDINNEKILWFIDRATQLQHDVDILKNSNNKLDISIFDNNTRMYGESYSDYKNYGNRIANNKILNFLSTFSISGYAIPGVILAIAFITFIAWFDDNIIKSFGFGSIKKIFIGSILGLVLVYFIRFYSLAFNGIKSGYEKINISVDESAYLLGFSKRKTFMNIHVPFLRNSLLFIIILN